MVTAKPHHADGQVARVSKADAHANRSCGRSTLIHASSSMNPVQLLPVIALNA